jgi:hypothetical protein
MAVDFADYAARFCLPDMCLIARAHSRLAESSLRPDFGRQALTLGKAVLSCGPNAITLRPA